MSNTLKMDVAAALAVKSKIDNSAEEINDKLTTLNRTVDDFIQMDWKGSSARQFQDIFKQLMEFEQYRLQELKSLSTMLDEEIIQWQEMSSSLG